MKQFRISLLLVITSFLLISSCSDDDNLVPYKGEMPAVEQTDIQVGKETDISYSSKQDDGFSYEIIEGDDIIEVIEKEDGTHYIKCVAPGAAKIVLSNNAGSYTLTINVPYDGEIPAVEKKTIELDEEIAISHSLLNEDGFTYKITTGEDIIEVIEKEDAHYIKAIDFGEAQISLTNNAGTANITINVAYDGVNGIVVYTDQQGVVYNIDLVNKTASVAGNGANVAVNFSAVEGALIIPTHISYKGKEYPVTSIEENAFGYYLIWSGNASLRSLQFAEGSQIESIDIAAVANCDALTSVDFSNCTELTTIGEQAFYDCDALTNVDLNNLIALTTIGRLAFNGCAVLTNIDFSSCTALTTIKYRAFFDCEALTSIDFSNLTALTTIELNAFAYCGALTSVNLSGCTVLTIIDEQVFYGCDALTSVNLTDCTALTTIGEQAFYDCDNLTDVDFSSCTALTIIGEQAFINCNALTSVNFSSCTALTIIEEQAFVNCDALTNVNLTDCTALNTIKSKAFHGCNSDLSIPLPGTGWNPSGTIDSGNWAKTFTKS